MRRTILTILLFLCCLVLAADFYKNRKTTAQNLSVESLPGTYAYTGKANPFAVDFYLAGEWEYYPGVLIYEEENGTNFQGGIGVFDPAAAGAMAMEDGPPMPSPEAEDNTKDPSFYASLNRSYISVPFQNMSQFFQHTPKQVSSYRMVVTNLPPTDDFDMLLSLQGLIYGDYEVYIDGHRTQALLPPYGHPAYYFPVPASGQVEFVIQTRNTVSQLNIIPRISYKGIGMESFDNYRNVIFIILAIILTAIFIMVFLMFSLDRKYLYLPFITGVLFVFNYFLNNLWASGYQGTITAVIPQYLIPHLAWFTFAGALAMAPLFRRALPVSHRQKPILRVTLLLLAIAAGLRILHLILLRSAVLTLLSDILILVVILLELILSYVWVKQITRADFLCQAGLFLMIAGEVSASIHQMFGIWNIFLYFQPVTIMIYTGLVFYNNKSNQIHLLARTRELLELEKESSKMQTAMLSSQIQPHFLYNTLTSIQELCYSDPDAAADLIVTFSQYLRSNLDFMNYEDLIPFSKELDHIHNFMYIQNARYKDAIEYTEEIETTDFLLPPLSVQPLVENAVKHGIMKENAEGKILLKVYEADDAIHILVQNDGAKFTEADLKKGHSMENIRARLQHLTGGELRIHVEDGKPETCVEVVIPI